jgi:hypothetical protein
VRYLPVAGRYRVAVSAPFLDMIQRLQGDRRMQFGQAGVQAWKLGVVVPGVAIVTGDAKAVGEIRVVGRYQPTFGSVHHLGGGEAEHLGLAEPT